MSTSAESSPLLSVRNLLLFAAWSCTLLGALQVHQWEGLFGHAICGPWGCGPPVSALVGYHVFWCLLIFPVAAILKHRWCPTASRHLGTGLALVSVAGLVSLLLLDGLNNSAAEQYLLRWCLFRVATFVDFPLVQLGLAGLWLWRSTQLPQQCPKVLDDQARQVSEEIGLSTKNHDKTGA